MKKSILQIVKETATGLESQLSRLNDVKSSGFVILVFGHDYEGQGLYLTNLSKESLIKNLNNFHERITKEKNGEKTGQSAQQNNSN